MTVDSLPPLVQAALKLAKDTGFTFSSTPAVGRLLSILAGLVEHGTAGELGSGCGVGTAWLASALPSTSTLVTVERDPDRCRSVRQLVSKLSNVLVLEGDWHEALQFGPFDLLFLDGGGDFKGSVAAGRRPNETDTRQAIESVRVGGLLLLDDFSPVTSWPIEWRGLPDRGREFWLGHPQLRATEITVDQAGGPASMVLIATRLS